MGALMNSLFAKPETTGQSNWESIQQQVEVDGHIKRVSLYNGEHKLEFNEKSHRYKVNGDYMGGVTSMLARLNKGDALIQWAANCAVEAYEKGADAATAKSAWKNQRDTAANTGKDAHAWISHFLATGERLELSPDFEPCVNAFDSWWTAAERTKLQTERIIYSHEHKYCGTCDLVFDMKIPTSDKVLRVVGDFKTGSPDKEWKAATKSWRGGYTGKMRAYQEHFMQCALYDQALTEEDGMAADLYTVIYLTKEGKLFTFMTDRTSEYLITAIRAVDFCATEKLLKEVHGYIYV